MPPRSTHETYVSNEVVLSELRGLASTVNARFDGVEREQTGMKSWMDRLSMTVERVADATAKIVLVESKLGGIEGDQSDLKLEFAALNERISKIEKNDVKTNFIRDGMIGGLGALLTGAATFLFANVKL